jgi:hypothetical protein
MNIDIGGDETFNIKNKETISELKEWYITTDISNPLEVDWIWSVVDKLQLESIIATKLINKNGIISIENGNQSIAMQQRLEIGNLLFQVSINQLFYLKLYYIFINILNIFI